MSRHDELQLARWLHDAITRAWPEPSATEDGPVGRPLPVGIHGALSHHIDVMQVNGKVPTDFSESYARALSAANWELALFSVRSLLQTHGTDKRHILDFIVGIPESARCPLLAVWLAAVRTPAS